MMQSVTGAPTRAASHGTFYPRATRMKEGQARDVAPGAARPFKAGPRRNR